MFSKGNSLSELTLIFKYLSSQLPELLFSFLINGLVLSYIFPYFSNTSMFFQSLRIIYHL